MHEKSILLPLLPLTALAAASPLTASWLPLVASFSMFPLLIRDGAALPYMALCALYIVLIWPSAVQQAREGIERLEAAHPKGRRRWLVRAWVRLVRALLRAANVLLVGSCAGMVALHAARELVPPPERYAWLYDRAFISYAFVHFAAAFVFAQIGQWVQGAMPLPAKTKTQ